MLFVFFVKTHAPLHVTIVKLNLKENIKRAIHTLIIFTEISLKYLKDDTIIVPFVQYKYYYSVLLLTCIKPTDMFFFLQHHCDLPGRRRPQKN